MQASLRETYFRITRSVRDFGPISRGEIAADIGMSPATVSRGIERLIDLKVIIEVGQRSKTKAGRPSTLLELNPAIGTVLTVDLRLTKAFAAITDMAGTILSQRSRLLAIEDPDQSVNDLKNLIQETISSRDASHPIDAIVIGAPSIVAHEGLIEWAPSLGWKNLPLKKILEEEFHCGVCVENDVNLAVLGEYWKGVGNHAVKNLVFVSVGTGIGAGLILNGDLYRGSTFAAGEVSYFITDVHVLRDNAGQAGSLENRVGYQGFLRTAQLVAQRYPTSKLANLFQGQSAQIQFFDVIDLAEKGDAAAKVVYNELIDILTIVICNISVMMDPEMIILGGPSDLKLSSLVPAIEARVGNSLLRPIHLLPSQLGNDALITGGAYVAFSLLKVFDT